jgi:hypothetical protein
LEGVCKDATRNTLAEEFAPPFSPEPAGGGKLRGDVEDFFSTF